jgi:hypothetical protein
LKVFLEKTLKRIDLLDLLDSLTYSRSFLLKQDLIDKSVYFTVKKSAKSQLVRKKWLLLLQVSPIMPGGYATVGAAAFSGAVTHTISISGKQSLCWSA